MRGPIGRERIRTLRTRFETSQTIGGTRARLPDCPRTGCPDESTRQALALARRHGHNRLFSALRRHRSRPIDALRFEKLLPPTEYIAPTALGATASVRHGCSGLAAWSAPNLRRVPFGASTVALRAREGYVRCIISEPSRFAHEEPHDRRDSRPPSRPRQPACDVKAISADADRMRRVHVARHRELDGRPRRALRRGVSGAHAAAALVREHLVDSGCLDRADGLVSSAASSDLRTGAARCGAGGDRRARGRRDARFPSEALDACGRSGCSGLPCRARTAARTHRCRAGRRVRDPRRKLRQHAMIYAMHQIQTCVWCGTQPRARRCAPTSRRAVSAAADRLGHQ